MNATLGHSYAWASDGIYGVLQAGFNLGRFSTSGPQENRRGLIFGGGIELPLGGNFFLQPEVNYVEKGQRSTLSAINNLGATDAFVKYDFVDVAVLTKVKFGRNDLKLEILAGPYYGFALTRALVVSTSSGDTLTDASSSLASSDYGGMIGIGADFKAGIDTAFYFNGRYVYGLANLASTTGGTVTSVSNRGIFLSFGYRFLL